MAGKYASLGRFLSEQATSPIEVSSQTIEDLIGGPLPRSARAYPEWWANDPHHAQAESWIGTGWKTEQVDMAGERVVFRRETGGD